MFVFGTNLTRPSSGARMTADRDPIDIFEELGIIIEPSGHVAALPPEVQAKIDANHEAHGRWLEEQARLQVAWMDADRAHPVLTKLPKLKSRPQWEAALPSIHRKNTWYIGVGETRWRAVNAAMSAVPTWTRDVNNKG